MEINLIFDNVPHVININILSSSMFVSPKEDTGVLYERQLYDHKLLIKVRKITFAE